MFGNIGSAAVNRKEYKTEIQFAVKQTMPVFFGYIFLGIAYGLLLRDAGYGVLWAFGTSLFIYAGSMQFLLVALLSGGAGLLYSAVMTLLINGRHLFYGLSFIEKFKKMGKAYPYMIFSLTDETYSVLCGCKVPEGLEAKRVWFMISCLDQCYWIIGSVLGNTIGKLVTFDSTGIDFTMTALFVVIMIEQWIENKNHIPAVIGAVSAFVFLLLLGADNFIIPSLAVTVFALLLCKGRLGGEAV